jgi:hypothetical protein
MIRRLAIACALTAALIPLGPAAAAAQNASPLGGVWTLNRSASEMPPEIGFDVNWFPAPSGGGGQSAGTPGGRGRRGSSGGGSRGGGAPFSVPREGYDDARRVQLLTAEARNPPARLMIVDTPATVTFTNELGQSRAIHPAGKEESIEIEGVPTSVTSHRDGDRLIVLYHVERDRDVRFTYSRAAGAPQLVVEVEFLERGKGDKAKRVYDVGGAAETAAAPAREPAAAPAAGASRPAESFDERPGAELRGLKTLGLLVEDLSATARACGLDHDAIEAALSKRLGDAGFTVRRNSDDDTYVYANVMTTTMPNGVCVSRYDAFLYTHATANLSYRDRPVLVQVSLMHRGGMGSSAPAGHSSAVTHGLEGYVDLFVTQIRDANRN